ncbi:MAG: hypothetical protein ACREJ6_15440, partial [Candidatus Methylomirabilis sp.]
PSTFEGAGFCSGHPSLLMTEQAGRYAATIKSKTMRLALSNTHSLLTSITLHAEGLAKTHH